MTNRLHRRAALLGLTAAVLAACGGGDVPAPAAPVAAPPPPAPPPPPTSPFTSAGVALTWSDLATQAMLTETAERPPGLSPMEQSRILAMAFIAGHDALNSVVRRYQPYAYDPSRRYVVQPSFAFEVAVCAVLNALMPANAAAFTDALQRSLAAGNIGPNSEEVVLGEASAAAILARRAADGSADAQGPYLSTGAPGNYVPTLPVGVATFVNWGRVQPFAMTSGAQFRAPAPYATTDARYAVDYLEAKLMGGAGSAARTDRETQIALTWLESTPLSWQRILADLYRRYSPGLWDVARGFALLQIAQADAYIGALEAKYHYNFWRPITAIRAAADDGNGDTVPDPGWTPLDPVTPPVPEYPSAHALAGSAGSVIVSALFRDYYYTFWDDPIVYRSSSNPGGAFSFESVDEIAQAIGLSRIYVGYHFRLAVEVGWGQGADVGQWVLDNQLAQLP